MNCRDAQIYLSTKLDGEISLEQDRKIEEHLRFCPSCQKEWQNIQKEETVLKRIIFDDLEENYWPKYTYSLQKKINSLPPQDRNWTRSFSLAASLLILAVLGMYFFLDRTNQDKPTENKFVEKSKSPTKEKFSLSNKWGSLAWERKMLSKTSHNILDVRYLLVDFYKKRPERIPFLWLQENFHKSYEVKELAFAVCAQEKTHSSFNLAKKMYSEGDFPKRSLQVMFDLSPQSSLEEMLKALENPELREVASRLFQKFPQSSLFLSQKMKNARGKIPLEWWSLLVQIGDDQAFQVVSEFAQKGSLRHIALRFLDQFSRKEASQIYFKGLRNHRLRQECLAGLRRMIPQSTKTITSFLYQEDVSLTRLAIETLGLIGDSSAVDYLSKFMDHPELSDDALEALVTLKSPKTEDLFLRLTHIPKYRKRAFQALAHFPTPKVLRFLIYHLYQNQNQSLALEAIKHFRNPEVIPHLLKIVNKSSLYQEILEALAEMPPKKVIPYFIVFLGDSRLRKKSHTILKEITGQKFGPNTRLWQIWYQNI